MTDLLDSTTEAATTRAELVAAVAKECREATASPRESHEHKWPAVRVRETTDAERTQALADGISALEELISEEELKLAMARKILADARACASQPAKLTDRMLMNQLAEQIDAFEKRYKDEWMICDNVTGEMNELNDTATRMLGLVSGRELFVAGGDISSGDEFFQTTVDHICENIDRHGIAEGAELLENAQS